MYSRDRWKGARSQSNYYLRAGYTKQGKYCFPYVCVSVCLSVCTYLSAQKLKKALPLLIRNYRNLAEMCDTINPRSGYRLRLVKLTLTFDLESSMCEKE